MFVVANQAGLDKFLCLQQLRRQITRASLKMAKRALYSVTSHNQSHLTESDSELMRGLYEPKNIDQATQAPRLPWRHGYGPSTDEDKEGRIRPYLKRYDPHSMVYTDGSYQKDTNLAGTGVYGRKEGVEERIRIRPSRPGFSPHYKQGRAYSFASCLVPLARAAGPSDCHRFGICKAEHQRTPAKPRKK